MRFEDGVQVVVFDLQLAAGVAAGAGADAPIALEEKALGLRALHGNFVAEGNLHAVGDDHGVPQAVEVARCLRGGGRGQGRGQANKGRDGHDCPRFR